MTAAQFAFCAGFAFGVLSAVLVAAQAAHQQRRALRFAGLHRFSWESTFDCSLPENVSMEGLAGWIGGAVAQTECPPAVIAPGEYAVHLTVEARFAKQEAR